MLKAVETIKREIDVINMNELKPGCAYYITHKVDDNVTKGMVGLCTHVSEATFVFECIDTTDGKLRVISLNVNDILNGGWSIVSRFSAEEEARRQHNLEVCVMAFKNQIMDPAFKELYGIDPAKEV